MTAHETNGPPSRRELLAGVGLGALIGGGGWIWDACRDRGAARIGERGGGIVGWIADRQGNRVCAFDRDLHVALSLPLPRPRRVIAGEGDSHAWVLFGVRPARLGRITSGGFELVNLGQGTPLDLARGVGGAPLALCREPDGSTRLVRVDAGARVSTVGRPGVARWVASSPWGALVGGGRSDLWLFDSAEANVLRAYSEGSADVVAARAGGAGWWLLEERGKGVRLTHCSPTLGRRWTRSVGLRAAGPIAAVPDPVRVGAPAVWLADERAALLQSFSSHGGRGPTIELPVASAVTSLRCLADGWLVALAGALLRLDRRGGVRAARGGFDALADLALVPR